jgi:hypothetical protein
LSGSEESAALEVLADEEVCDDVEDEPDVVGVGGARQVRVDIFARLLVQDLELVLRAQKKRIELFLAVTIFADFPHKKLAGTDVVIF